MENSPTSSCGSYASSTVHNLDQNCKCGVACKLQVSWTDKNPGRRFLECGRFDGFTPQCNFFSWHDPPVNNFLSSVVKGLRVKKLELEDVVVTQNVEIGLLTEKLNTEMATVHFLSEKLDIEKAALNVLNGELHYCKEKIIKLSMQVESHKAVLKKYKLMLSCIVVFLVARWFYLM